MNIKYNTVLGLVVVVQQNSSNALLLRNIQLTEEDSLPGIFMTLMAVIGCYVVIERSKNFVAQRPRGLNFVQI